MSPPTVPGAETPPTADVAVSIVCHDDRKALLRCLQSLPAACTGLSWSATVVQNLSLPDELDLDGEFPWVRTVRNTVPAGFGTNHNQVLRPIVDERRARYALVLNDDTELAPDCVTTLVSFADDHPELGAVGPAMSWPDGTLQPSYYCFPTIMSSIRAAVRPTTLSCHPITHGKGWLGGACLLLRSEALHHVGLFDAEYFLFYEDVDLARRLWGAGWGSAVCPAASITHFAHATVARADMSLVMDQQMIRSQYLYFKQYRGPLAASLLATASRAAFLGRATIALLRWMVTHDHSHRDLARRMMSFVRYRPTTLLAHEIIAAGRAATRN